MRQTSLKPSRGLLASYPAWEGIVVILPAKHQGGRSANPAREMPRHAETEQCVYLDECVMQTESEVQKKIAGPGFDRPRKVVWRRSFASGGRAAALAYFFLLAFFLPAFLPARLARFFLAMNMTSFE